MPIRGSPSRATHVVRLMIVLALLAVAFSLFTGLTRQPVQPVAAAEVAAVLILGAALLPRALREPRNPYTDSSKAPSRMKFVRASRQQGRLIGAVGRREKPAPYSV